MPPRPNGAFVLSFVLRGVIAVVITHAKLFVNRFRGFGVLTSRNFAISIGLAGRSYNSVSTAVLHCDSNLHELDIISAPKIRVLQNVKS